MTLDEIGLKCGTDKASDGHGYLERYERFFAPIREKEISILEIGVQYGPSMAMWEEYFPNAHIFGIDVDRECLKFATERVAIDIVSQADKDALDNYGKKVGPWNIIIDDGSHWQNDQQCSFGVLFPWYLKSGGFYAIEDLQCSYEEHCGGGFGNPGTTVEFLKRQIDELHHYKWDGTNPYGIKAISFFNSLAIIERK